MKADKSLGPVAEYFALCRDSTGALREDRIQYAIAAAFRAGFDECRMQITTISTDRCSVRLPVWPVDQKKIDMMVVEIRRDMAVKQSTGK
jgi:hypothetical protein